MLQTISTGVAFTSNDIEGLDVSIVANCTGAVSVESPSSCANVTTNIMVSVLGKVHQEPPYDRHLIRATSLTMTLPAVLYCMHFNFCRFSIFTDFADLKFAVIAIVLYVSIGI